MSGEKLSGCFADGTPMTVPHLSRVAEEVLALNGPVAEPLPCGPPTFMSIAGYASCHEITRGPISVLHSRLNVIYRELAPVQYLGTVHTTIVVTFEYLATYASCCGRRIHPGIPSLIG